MQCSWNIWKQVQYQELIHAGLAFFQIYAFDGDLLLPGHTVGSLDHSRSSASYNTQERMLIHQELHGDMISGQIGNEEEQTLLNPPETSNLNP